MRRQWSVSALAGGAPGEHSPPWRCQLIHHERTAEELVLDLVALEACPASGCPRHTPFTMHIGTRSGDPSAGAVLAGWAAGADLITIVGGVADSGPAWLCLSAGGRHLLLQV